MNTGTGRVGPCMSGWTRLRKWFRPPTHSKVGRSSRMYQEYKDLLSAFHAHGVRYLIVGGYAVIFHAQPRFTKDIDLFIKADPSNAQATYAALAEFGAQLQGIC